MFRLLLVEDDQTIGETLAGSLRMHGYAVSWVQSGQAALDHTATAHTVTDAAAIDVAATDDDVAAGVDLVLLDLGLPDLDGVEVCRRLRSRLPHAVLVILTARDEEMDVVVGLEAGADDYLTKPARLAELLARVRAHLRRGPARATGPEELSVGALRVDVAARRASVAGVDLALRAKEFDLLARLAEQPGTAVSRDALMTDVWDAHWYGSTKTLDVHIAALRRKLARAAPTAAVPQISTLRGHGYRLERPES
jgi:DNA-binding response OmpR family regulator